MGRASQIFWYLNAETIPTGVDLLSTYTKIDLNSKELKALRRAFLREKRMALMALGDHETNVELFPGQSLMEQGPGEVICEACDDRTEGGHQTQLNLFVVPAPGQ